MLDPVFLELADSTIAEMEQCGYTDSTSYFLYLFEMLGEGMYHFWLQVHPFSQKCLAELPETWDENIGIDLFWPEGYFYRKGVLCLVRTSYPCVNFSFLDHTDMVPFPIDSNGDAEDRCKWLMLMWAAQTEQGIKHPFHVELGCDR